MTELDLASVKQEVVDTEKPDVLKMTTSKRTKRGRKPAKVDVKAKLERSRQSARECRARKKLRYQYLEELVSSRERAVYSLRKELETCKQWCVNLDDGRVQMDMLHRLQMAEEEDEDSDLAHSHDSEETSKSSKWCKILLDSDDEDDMSSDSEAEVEMKSVSVSEGMESHSDVGMSADVGASGSHWMPCTDNTPASVDSLLTDEKTVPIRVKCHPSQTSSVPMIVGPGFSAPVEKVQTLPISGINTGACTADKTSTDHADSVRDTSSIGLVDIAHAAGDTIADTSADTTDVTELSLTQQTGDSSHRIGDRYVPSQTCQRDPIVFSTTLVASTRQSDVNVPVVTVTTGVAGKVYTTSSSSTGAGKTLSAAEGGAGKTLSAAEGGPGKTLSAAEGGLGKTLRTAEGGPGKILRTAEGDSSGSPENLSDIDLSDWIAMMKNT